MNTILTTKNIPEILEKATPIKGVDYFDGQDGVNGKDGLSPDPEIIIEKVLSQIPKPKDGKPGKDGKDGKDGKSIKGDKGDPGKNGKNPDPLDVVEEIRNLKGNNRLDISNLRNSEQLLGLIGKKINTKDQRWHGGGITTVQQSGIEITNKGTALNFTGSGLQSVTENNGVVTINISGGAGTVTSVASADGSITVTNPTTTVDLSVVKSPKLTTGRTISISGDLSYTSPSFDGSANVTAAGTLATVNSNVGTFGSATQVGQFTVNGKGLMTAAAAVSIQIAESQVTNLVTDLAAKQSTTLTNTHILVGNGSNIAADVALSGDATLANTGALTLATVNSNVGSFTNANITVDAKGRITAASSGSSGSGLTIGTTTITSGTDKRILYDNAGVLGEYTLTGTGTVAVMQTSPTLITPLLGTPTSGVLTNCTGLPAASVVAGTFGTGAYTMDTSLTVPKVIGGTLTTSNLILQATSGGAGAGQVIIKTGNNGATTAMTIDQFGIVTVPVQFVIDTYGQFSVNGSNQLVIKNTSGQAVNVASNSGVNFTDGSNNIYLAFTPFNFTVPVIEFILTQGGTSTQGIKFTQSTDNHYLQIRQANGGGTTGFKVFAVNDIANSAITILENNPSGADLISTKTGTGTTVGIRFLIDATVAASFDTSGNFIPADGHNIILGTTTGTKIGTGTTQKIGFYNATPVVQQTDGAALTNSVTSGGTTNTIADYSDLVIYANDAAAIRNDIYQLARKLKIVDDALRTYGLLS